MSVQHPLTWLFFSFVKVTVVFPFFPAPSSPLLQISFPQAVIVRFFFVFSAYVEG